MLRISSKWLIAIVLVTGTVKAQSTDPLDIYSCFKAAENLSPLKKQDALIRTDRELNLKNISAGYLPDISLAGKATYQSDVFTFPISNPAFDIPEIPKDQYQVTLNLQQKIFDSGVTRGQRMVQEAKSSLAENQLNTDLYNIKDIVSQLYFSALIFQENQKILDQSKETMLSQQKLIRSRVDNGAVLPSALFSIEKELATLDQQIIQVKYNHKTSLELLSQWIGKDLGEDTELTIPKADNGEIPAINRPELKLFSSQQQLLQSSKSLSASKQLPYVYLFAQGGYGSPNPFNFFETKFSDFYILGVQLNWKPFNWGITGREKQSLQVQQDEIASKKEDFERNISMNLLKEKNDNMKLQEMIEKDDNIVSLQQKIVDQYFSQMQNGVITPTDYLTEFNSLTNAKVSRQIHHIQLSQSSLNLLIKSGNIENQ